MVGNRLGKGTVFALEMENSNLASALVNALTKSAEPATVFKAASTGISYLQTSSTGIREIRSPAGGVM